MFPELLQFVNERVLQLVERREHAIGDVLAQMTEDLLSLVQFGTVGWQIERMHASWPADLSTAMTPRTVQHYPKWPLAQLMAQMTKATTRLSAGWAIGVPKFFKGGLLLDIGFLVPPAPGLPLDPMLLEEPPERLAVFVPNASYENDSVAARRTLTADLSRVNTFGHR